MRPSCILYDCNRCHNRVFVFRQRRLVNTHQEEYGRFGYDHNGENAPVDSPTLSNRPHHSRTHSRSRWNPRTLHLPLSLTRQLLMYFLHLMSHQLCQFLRARQRLHFQANRLNQTHVMPSPQSIYLVCSVDKDEQIDYYGNLVNEDELPNLSLTIPLLSMSLTNPS
jgi:hypothetical protein